MKRIWMTVKHNCCYVCQYQDEQAANRVYRLHQLLARQSGKSQQTHTDLTVQSLAKVLRYYLPAWIRVADCRRAWRLRRWYRSQQH